MTRGGWTRRWVVQFETWERCGHGFGKQAYRQHEQDDRHRSDQLLVRRQRSHRRQIRAPGLSQDELGSAYIVMVIAQNEVVQPYGEGPRRQ